MFPWQSNSSTRDTERTSTEDEAPETPAHLFPVRAFKHAIFGTPAPPKTDRKQIRTRPQSSHDRPRSRDEDCLSRSPGKAGGILRTPGTGGQKRKSVSFGGAGATSYEAAVGAHLGEHVTDDVSENAIEEPRNSRAGPSKASDFARRLRGEPKELPISPVQEDVTMDMDAPRSKSGKYWKDEYETYSTNTERQLKKLAKKEQVAKKYAQMKDGTASQLEDDLKFEQARAHDLECKVDDFKRQLESALRSTNQRDLIVEKDKELERLRKENEQLRSQLRAQWHAQAEAKMSPTQIKPRSLERPAVARAKTEPTAVTPPPDKQPLQQPRRRAEQSRVGQALSARENVKEPQKEPSDIWADAAGSTIDALPATSRQTPRKRPQDREPLAQRTENVESRSSSAAATLGTKATTITNSEQQTVVSRSSSTAGTLGSKRPSMEANLERLDANNVDHIDHAPHEDKKRKEMSLERQAAARKRLEERKKAKQRAAG
ncbi:MAG: hypothetical protein Q9159_007647 [Coniocarpon cinnabarinum]